jgi:hypothetical protein
MECFSNPTIYFVIANIQILGEHHKLSENQLKFHAKGKIILLTTLSTMDDNNVNFKSRSQFMQDKKLNTK